MNKFPGFIFLSAFVLITLWGCPSKPLKTVEMTKEFTNHLAGETSPYLLQHAGNPVDWYPWSRKAIEKAKQENKK